MAKTNISKQNVTSGPEIKRRWGDVPVRDATESLRVYVTKQDVSRAVSHDPERCVLARACQRMFGSDKVMFFRTVAFVKLTDEKGAECVERFTLSEGARKVVETFDRGGKIASGTTFILTKPIGNRALSVKRLQKKYPSEGSAPQRAAICRPVERDLSVRLGTGLAKFC